MEINYEEVLKSINRNWEHYVIMAPTEETLNRYHSEVDKKERFEYKFKKYNEFEITRESRNIVEMGIIIEEDLEKKLISNFTLEDIIQLSKMSATELADRVKSQDKKLAKIRDVRKFEEYKEAVKELVVNDNPIPLRDEFGVEESLTLKKEIEGEFAVNKERYLVLDTETNSLYRKKQKDSGLPIQIAYLVTDLDKIYGRDSFYIQQPWIDPNAEKIHQISKEKLEAMNAYSQLEAYFRISDVLKMGNKLTCHNLSFDVGVLNRFISKAIKENSGEPIGMGVTDIEIETNSFCTLKESRAREDIKAKSNKLEDLVNYYGYKEELIVNLTKQIFGDSGIGAHDARYDVVATTLLLKELKAN